MATYNSPIQRYVLGTYGIRPYSPMTGVGLSGGSGTPTTDDDEEETTEETGTGDDGGSSAQLVGLGGMFQGQLPSGMGPAIQTDQGVMLTGAGTNWEIGAGIGGM